MDRLRLPNHALFIGKNREAIAWVMLQILENIQCFENPPKHVYFLYEFWNKCFDGLKPALAKHGIELQFRNVWGFRPYYDIPRTKDQQLYLFADRAYGISLECSYMTTANAHRNVSFWLLWDGSEAGYTIRTTCFLSYIHYIFLFPGYDGPIRLMDEELGFEGTLLRAYKLAVTWPCDPDDNDHSHRYLFFDFSTYWESRPRYKCHVHQPEHQIELVP